MIGELFELVFGLIEALACPFKLWENIPKCVWYWFLDFVCFLVWLFIYLFILCFIYWELVLLLLLIWAISQAFNPIDFYSFLDDLDSIFPSKTTVGISLDNLLKTIGVGNLFYRSKNDIDDCYCVPALVVLFDPLQTYYDYIPAYENMSSDTYITICFYIALIIFLFFTISNAMKQMYVPVAPGVDLGPTNILPNVAGVDLGPTNILSNIAGVDLGSNITGN
jgi:hypothetical protein